MPVGPGKYDDLCTYAREQAQATAAMVIIVGGKHGPGFAMQTADLRVQLALPQILRNIADEIERSAGKSP